MKKIIAGLFVAAFATTVYAADFVTQLPASPNLDYFMSKVAPMFSSSAVGYSAGNGGAVTQTSSRTTGVTLNNLTGAITLVSAAGSATPASFTVTDSAVLATDTIIVNEKSGTDLYEIFVTNVAAGSFKITSFTTGGTTTEQPVFNFAMIRGQSS